MSFGAPNDGVEIETASRTREKFRVGDIFYVQSSKLRVSLGDARTRVGDTLKIRGINNTKGTITVTVDLFHPGETHHYTSLDITPGELDPYQQERRAGLKLNPSSISPERIDELADTDPFSFPCRKSDTPQQVRKLTVEAIRDRLNRSGLTLS